MMRRLFPDERGATLVEFAILLPVLLALLMGLMDLCYQAYVQAVLEGAVQKAARDSTIEAADISTIDTRVVTAVRRVAGKASVTPNRLFYASFALIKPEDFADSNGNGIHDPGECFTDVNGYRVTVHYTRLFPLARLIGWSNQVVLSASTRFKNQPYGTQSIPTPQLLCK